MVSPADLSMVPNLLNGKNVVGLGPVILLASAPDDLRGVLVRKDGEVFRELENAAAEAGYPHPKVFEESGGDVPLRVALLSLFNGDATPGTTREAAWEAPLKRCGELARAAGSFVTNAFLGDAGMSAGIEGATGMIVLFVAFDDIDQKHKKFVEFALDRICRQFKGYTLDRSTRAEGQLPGSSWKFRAIRYLRIPE